MKFTYTQAKGSGCFEVDITAFSVPDGGNVTLQLDALRNGSPLAVSQKVSYIVL